MGRVSKVRELLECAAVQSRHPPVVYEAELRMAIDDDEAKSAAELTRLNIEVSELHGRFQSTMRNYVSRGDEIAAKNERIAELEAELAKRELPPLPESVRDGRSSIVRYTQVEAIHEAMRELEAARMPLSHNPYAVFHEDDVGRCMAKIRASLAGETPESNARPFNLYEAGREGFLQAKLEHAALFDEADDRMVRPEDVAPPIAERDNEDSKITWQG